MSCYQQESGSFILPSKEFAAFRRKLIDAHNDNLDHEYNIARRLYDRLIEQGQGQRGFSYERAFEQLLASEQQRDRSLHEDGCHRIGFSLFRDSRSRSLGSKPFAPRKKDFPKLATNALAIASVEWSISFHPEQRRVGWEVAQNNHSVDHARAEPIPERFFHALHAVPWTRKTGGFVSYSDEYAGERISSAHGPLGEREQTARNEALRAYMNVHLRR